MVISSLLPCSVVSISHLLLTGGADGESEYGGPMWQVDNKERRVRVYTKNRKNRVVSGKLGRMEKTTRSSIDAEGRKRDGSIVFYTIEETKAAQVG